MRGHLGDSETRRQSWRVDAGQMNECRLFGVGPNHEVREILIGRVEFRANAGAGLSKVLSPDVRQKLLRVLQERLGRPSIVFVIRFSGVIPGIGSYQHVAVSRFGEMKPEMAADARKRID